jgi:succinate dehydrogenase (ubiquinone) membrane anchor subunit
MWRLAIHHRSLLFIPKACCTESLVTTTSIISRPSYGLWNSYGSGHLSTSSSTVEPSPPLKGKSHGSYHWIVEKLASVLLVGLIPATFIAPHPGMDYALGILLPIHCHLGVMQVITDYLPKRKFPIIYFVSSNGLRLATFLTLCGLYLLNSEDIGITATVRRFWSL